jgi:hypothetical protein
VGEGVQTVRCEVRGVPSSGMLRCVALVRIDVFGGKYLLHRGVTSQKTAVFIVTAMKTSNLT